MMTIDDSVTIVHRGAVRVGAITPRNLVGWAIMLSNIQIYSKFILNH